MIIKNCKRCKDDIDCLVNNKKAKPDNLEILISKPDSFDSILSEYDDTSVILENEKIEENLYEVEYLETPVTLDDDCKQYRTIKLKNGLTALLISDCDSYSSNKNKKIYHSNVNVLSGNIIDDEKDIKNNFKDLKTAFCSLFINVGNFSDPFNMQGLAHLLEHMISMGCKKYPKENEYDSFVHKRAGNTNAHTESEGTTFYLDISEKYLLEALDRFANLFINPTITKDAIIREIQAVESEFKLVQQDDIIRIVQLKHSFIKMHHPASKFSWGNLKSLKNVHIDDLYSELHIFQKRHYSAHRMTLTIQASKPLNELEKYVIDCFSDIPSNNLPPDDFSRFVGTDSFESLKFKKLYNVKNIKDTSEIELSWVMPPTQHLYKIKPLGYIYYLLSQKGEGSLLNYLFQKLWVFAINIGGDATFEYNSMYSLFTISLSLTDKGYNHILEILNSVFAYIKLLQREGINELLFEHVKNIKEKEFRSYMKVREDFVKIVSENMQHYPPVDYLHGYDLLLEYNPKVIQSYMEALCPENINIIVSSKKFNNEMLNEIEPWFQTKYSCTDIPKEWITDWKTIEPLPDFKLFIEDNEDNFTNNIDEVINYSNTEQFYPVKMDCINGVELWQKQLPESRSSEFYVYLHLIIPDSANSLLRVVMLHLLTIILDPKVTSYLTETNNNINLSVNGIILESIGNDKLSSLKQIVNILTDLRNCENFISERLFALAKRKVLKTFYNSFIDPCNLNVEIWLSLTISDCWLSSEKYNALNDLTYDQFHNYVKNFPKECFIQCLIIGNLTDDKYSKDIYEAISWLPLHFSLLKTCPKPKSYKYTTGEKCCQVKNFNSTDSNTVVTNYYQIDTYSVKLYIILYLLTIIIQEPLFYHLRTLEQLGYKITCSQYCVSRNPCMAISVVTQANKFTAAYIDERITNFLNCFKDTLKDLSNEELDYVKENCIQAISETDKSIEFNWNKIVLGQYVPGRSLEEINVVKDITVSDIYEHFVNYMIAGPKYRKLSVQVVGTTDSNNLDPKTNNLGDKNYSLLFSPEVTDEIKQNTGYYISNIGAYNQQLDVYTEE